MFRTNVVFWFVLAVGLLLASAAGAKKYCGVDVPESVLVADRVLHLNGSGVHEATIFGVDVFVGSFYLEGVSSDATAILNSPQVKQLVLRFKRDVSRSDLREALGSLRKQRDAAALASFVDGVGQLHEGDVVSITELPNHSLELRHNGALISRLHGRRLCRAVFAHWIGARPVSGSLKRKLLRGHGLR